MKTAHLALFILHSILFACASATSVISSGRKTIRGVRGQYIHYHAEDSTCDSVVMLNVGTAMGVGAYSNLAADIVQQDSNTVVIIIDNSPGIIVKTSEKNFAGIANAIADDLPNIVSVCKALPTNKIIVGGHSAGGMATVVAIQKKLLNFDVAGYIGLAPYQIKEKSMSIDVPSLLWGFSKTSCAVTYTQAALAAYQISDPDKGRVFYQVQTNNWNTLTGGPHCTFTNSGCAGLCSGGEKFSWVNNEVGHSIGVFVKATAGRGIRKYDFEIEGRGINLFVNSDEVVASRKSGEGAVLRSAYA
mmetsp:Transcript_12198/g.25952  ORF Transcript_12198/g.25952 Transcript_12198/m.25952 type:complete len:302 (-) Transcript_12198:72-977(-)